MDNEAFVKSIGDFRESVSVDERPSWLKLATITMISKYLSENSVTLDHSVVRHVFSKMPTIKITSHTGQSYEWQMFNSEFYNQITIGYIDPLSTKKVKIFPNGSLQIAGCANLSDCSRFIKQLRLILGILYNVDIPKESFKIVMINSNFSMCHDVNQMNVIKAFSVKGCKVDFHPDRYSAVKIKFKPSPGSKELTTSIFGSGSVIISGAENIQEIFDAYRYIVTTMIGYPGIMLEKSAKVGNFDYFMGYSYTEWYQKIISRTSK